MNDGERARSGHPTAIGRNDPPLPDSGPPSEAIDAPIPGPAGPLRDPGAEPGDSEDDRRDELGRRSESGVPSPAGRDRPDVLPNVETPDRPM